MPTNSQIEKRLQKEYMDHIESDMEFKAYMHQYGTKDLDMGVELCYLPEFREGEEYKFKDERDDFQPDNNYLRRKQSCFNALSDISDKSGNYIITNDNLNAFFEKSLPLYLDLFHLWNYRAFHSFRHLFFSSVTWIEYYKIASKVKVALQQFNPYNKDDIEDWLEDYNRLFYTNSILWGSFLDLIDEEFHLYKHHNNDFNAYLQGEEITICIEFGEKYSFYEKKYFPRDEEE